MEMTEEKAHRLHELIERMLKANEAMRVTLDDPQAALAFSDEEIIALRRVVAGIEEVAKHYRAVTKHGTVPIADALNGIFNKPYH